MTKTEIIAALRQMSAEERLEIIEAISRMIPEEIEAFASAQAERKLSLAAAAEVMRPYYAAESELTEFTDLDTEDFYEYEDYA